MNAFPRGLTLSLAAAGALLAGAPIINVQAPFSKQVHYGPMQKEFYLAADQAAWLRPGLVYKVNSVTIGADRKPVVDINLTDDYGQPIDRNGIQTPGAVSISFILSWWDPGKRDFTSYAFKNVTSAISGKTATQATTDSGGVFHDIDVGHFTYTFKTVLPSGFDMTKTHTLGIYGKRTLPAEVLDGKSYYDNLEYDFRPDGLAVTEKWDAIQEGNACNQCHDPLTAHGDTRRDVKLCALCHSPQTSDPDTGNLLDIRVFIHKIHRGENLPSVKAGHPYQIIGHSDSVNDFSTVAFPQDIRNCQNCHEGRDPAHKPSQSDIWYTHPARAPCGACHDDIDWVTGAGHPAGPQANDNGCKNCHVPQGSQEWDASIKGAHTVPYRSKQLKGLNATIVSVEHTSPGEKPTVTYKLTENDGTILDPVAFTATGGSINILLGGPTTDYGTGQQPPAQPIRESAAASTFNGTVATYTFTHTVPAAATGSWAIAIESRRTINLSPAPKEGPTTYTEGAVNPIQYIAVTGGTAVPRRNVVILDNCNKCHDRLATLASHGGQRIAIEECDICHNPNANDSGDRPADAGKPESIVLKRMVHRIHSGENLTQDFTIYGHNASVNNFNELRYPGDRKDCVQCHTSTSTYNLPLPNGAIPAITERDYFSPQGPGTTGCLGCHDNVDAAAHAYLNTVFTPFFGEACATCHGDGKDWDVVKVHAR